MIVCQTTRLLDQYESALKYHMPTYCIHHENTTGVINTVYKTYNNFITSSGALLITWSTFQNINFANDYSMDVIFDEIPAIMEPITLNIAETHSIITECIIRAPETSVHSHLLPKDNKVLTSIYENRKKDNQYAYFQGLAGKLLSRHWSVYTNTAQYYKMITGKKSDQPEQIDFFTVLRTSAFKGFRSVIIGSANFEDSLLYELLKDDPTIKLKEHPEISRALRYKTHPNGSLLDIHYAINGNWSKNIMREPKAIEKVVAAFESVLNGNEYVWAANNSIEQSPFLAGASCRLPASPHGLNEFQRYHCVATIGAFNLKPSAIAFIEAKFGIPGERIRIAINNEMNYQIVCRTSLRDIDDNSRKIVCVPDENLALWLQSKFPGSTVNALNVKLESDFESTFKASAPRKAGAVRKKECLARKNERKKDRATELDCRFEAARRKLLSTEAEGEGSAHPPAGAEIQNDGNNSHLIDKGIDVTHFFGSIFANRKSREAIIEYCCDDFDEIIRFMKQCYKVDYKEKHSNFLISPTLFYPSNTEVSYRAKTDALYCGMIWLDKDYDGITEKEFSFIFPDINFIIFDTFSSTPKNRRFRICIPLKRPVLPDEYELLVKEIFDRLRYHGYDFKAGNGRQPHGFDKMGSLVTSLLYLPCRTGNSKANRLKAYKTNRVLLDPDKWLDNLLTPELPTSDVVAPPLAPAMPSLSDTMLSSTGSKPETDDCDSCEVKIERALAIWSFRQKKKGEGHKAFWTLALHLAKAGLGDEAIQNLLWKESFNALSVKQRQNEIDSILKTLRERGYFMEEPIPHSLVP